jgi:hypothetical protein
MVVSLLILELSLILSLNKKLMREFGLGTFSSLHPGSVVFLQP